MAETELYDVLGLTPSATDNEIKRAYHRLARQYHPDKNPGSEDKFKEVQVAYEILSNPEKRGLYDRFGMDGVSGNGGPSMFGGGGGLFSHLFGDDLFGFGGGRRRRQKNETIGIPLEVTLEELYKGATKSVEFKRKALCKTCNGTGGKSGSVVRCRKCHGQGIQITHRQIGPGMIQQLQSHCSDCGGTGDFIRERDRCKKCRGKRVLEMDHKLEVPISPGMKHDQKIPFRGEADEAPDTEAGDVIVILQQLDHTTFKRSDMDLFVEKKVSLAEALCGFGFVVHHLDDRKLLVKCHPGEVISPGSVRGIRDEGMPRFRHPDLKGNLYIRFDVEFPENNYLDEKGLKSLQSLLPTKPDEPAVEKEAEEVDMVDLQGTRGADGGRKEAYDDSDDDDEAGGPRFASPGCAHQ